MSSISSIGSWIGMNVTKAVNALPRVDVWLDNLQVHYMIAMAVAVFCTSIVIVIGAVHLYFVRSYITHPNVWTDLQWIVFMSPLIAVCACIGMFIPRSAPLLYSIGLVYSMGCIFMLVSLMTTLYGSRSLMCAKLAEHGVKLDLRVFPLGYLFCCCSRKLEPSPNNLRWLECMVFQSPFVRSFLEILNLVVFFELESKDNVFFQVTEYTSLISMLVASYASYVIIPAGSRHLKEYRLLWMLRLMDGAQFLYSLQTTVLDSAVTLGILTNDSILSGTASAHFWAAFMATVEMLGFSVAATILFRPSQTTIFDKYSSSTKERAPPPIKLKQRNVGDNRLVIDAPTEEWIGLPNKEKEKEKETDQTQTTVAFEPGEDDVDSLTPFIDSSGKTSSTQEV